MKLLTLLLCLALAGCASTPLTEEQQKERQERITKSNMRQVQMNLRVYR